MEPLTPHCIELLIPWLIGRRKTCLRITGEAPANLGGRSAEFRFLPPSIKEYLISNPLASRMVPFIMDLHGKHFIGAKLSARGKNIFSAVNPITRGELPPSFHDATGGEIEHALTCVEGVDEAAAVYLSNGTTGREAARFTLTGTRAASRQRASARLPPMAEPPSALTVAVTGRSVGPPLLESLLVLGRDRTLERLDRSAGPHRAEQDGAARQPVVAPAQSVPRTSPAVRNGKPRVSARNVSRSSVSSGGRRR
jgi:hypothetical protein